MCVSAKRDDILCFYHLPEFYRSTLTSYTITLSTYFEYINMYNVYIDTTHYIVLMCISIYYELMSIILCSIASLI